MAQNPESNLADFYRKVSAPGEPGVEAPLLVLRGNRPSEMTITSTDRYKWRRLKPTY